MNKNHNQLTKNNAKKLLAAPAVALLLAACADNKPSAPLTADEATVCEPGSEMQQFTFQTGQGINSAVHAIRGSGDGDTAACWSEAREIVEDQIDGRQIQAGELTITIPTEVHPVKGGALPGSPEAND